MRRDTVGAAVAAAAAVAMTAWSSIVPAAAAQAPGAGTGEEATSPPPAGPEYELRDTTLVVHAPDGATHPVALGCHGIATAAHEARLYVACGEQGVAVVDVASPEHPALIGLVDMGGAVEGFFVLQGEVWARIARREAAPVREAAAPATTSATAAPAAPATAPPAATSGAPVAGRVIESSAGEVVVTLGTHQGLRSGDHVQLYERRPEKVADQTIMSERTLAVGDVVEATEDRARVRLGFGERVANGTAARRTRLHTTRNLVAPPRQGGIVQIAAFVRPFVPVGDLGFGLLGEASVTYRARRPWFVRAFADTIGFGLGAGPDIRLFSGNVVAGYDHPIFEVGLGVGGMRVNDTETLDAEPQTAMSLAQTARFGALDGLHLAVTNSFVLLEEQTFGSIPPTKTHRRFEWGAIHVEIQAPVATTGWIVLRGGGGRTGHGFFEGGLRWAVRGNGGRGTLFLTPTVGGIWTFGSSIPRRGGPSIGLGVEYRL